MKWTDINDIAIELSEAHPAIDPLKINFVDLRDWLEIERDGVHVSLFSVISTFGTAQDVTADELRIESFFPCDRATEKLFASFASP